MSEVDAVSGVVNRSQRLERTAHADAGILCSVQVDFVVDMSAWPNE